MRHPSVTVLLFAVAASIAVESAAGDTPRIATTVNVDSVTVGQRFRVRFETTYPESLVLVPPETFDTGKSRILDLQWNDGSKDGQKTKQGVLTVLNLDLESAVVAPQRVLFVTPSGDTIVAHTDEVTLPVRRLAGDKAEERPLKPQWQAPRSYLYFYAAGAAIVLLALAIWLWRRRARRVVVEPPKPELPADFVALQALVEIENMGLLEKGDFKRYYTLVVDVVRRYLERRFGILAMDQTTYEILYDLEQRGETIDGLGPLLEEADLVKFAKYVPDAASGMKLMETSREIITRTRVRAPVVAEVVE